MKYASFKNYVEDNYSEYLLNEIKNFLSNENGAVIRNEDVSQFEIKSVFCESLADMNIKITVNVEMNIYRHMNGNATVEKKCFRVFMYANNKQRLTIDNVEIEELKEDVVSKMTIFNEYAIDYMTDEEMEQMSDELWDKYCMRIIGLNSMSYRFPYEILVQGWKMHIEKALLPEGIMGRMYFEKDEIDGLIIRPGTIVLNAEADYFMENVGNDLLTITHEITHWMAHRNFIGILRLLQGKNVLDCSSVPKKYTDNLSDIEKAVWIAEWQANVMALKLAMPRKLFLKELLKNFQAALQHTVTKYSCRAEAMESAVKNTAEIFNVSELAAKERAVQLGIMESTGTCIYIDDAYHFPFFFKKDTLKQQQTFLIDKKNLEKLCDKNKHLKALIDSKAFIYLGYVVCLNDPIYIEKIDSAEEKYDLSDYGRENVDKCCLVFDWKSDNDQIVPTEKEFYGQCYLNKNFSDDAYREYKYNKNNIINQTTEQLIKIFNSRDKLKAEQEKKMKELKNMNFSEGLGYHMDKKGISKDELAARTLLSKATIARYMRDSKKDIPLRNVVAVCIGLNLGKAYSYDLLEKAGRRFRENNEEDEIYKMLIDEHTDSNINECNEVILAWNQRAGHKVEARLLPDKRNNGNSNKSKKTSETGETSKKK